MAGLRRNAVFLLAALGALLAASPALALPYSASQNYAANNTLISGGGTNTTSSGFYSTSALSQLAVGNASSSSYNTSLGFFNLLNTAPSLASVSSNVSPVKSGDSIRITTSGAADEDGDLLRLECGESSGASNLCVGEYGSPERTCDFSAPWSDSAVHTVYCRVSDSSDSSPDRTVDITSDNAGPAITVDYPLNATYQDDILDLNITAEASESCWYNLNGGTNHTMAGSGTDWDAIMNTGGQGSFHLSVYCNDSLGNIAGNSTIWFSVSLLDLEISKVISPSLLVARTNETTYVNATAKVNMTKYGVAVINITDEIPYDFGAPSAPDVKVYFIDYAPYSVKEITGNATVNVDVVDQAGSLPTLLMVNISDVSETSAGTDMAVNDSILIVYSMISSQMEPNEYRNIYTNASIEDINSNTKFASILKTISSSEVVLRGYKSIWIPDLSNPQLLSGEIIIKAIGGPVSGILLSDYLPQGATLSGVNVTYYNQSTGNTLQLVNGSDYYVSEPAPDTLPDGTYVDVYYYNFSYAYVHWDGNLYDNDTITIRYNISVTGGGQWILPAIIAGWDPTYKKNIKTETFANANVPLFDVIVETITKIVNPGELVKAALKMINVGGPNAQVDVFNTYSVKTMTGSLIVEKSETFAVQAQKEMELSLQTPSSMAPGMYTFEVLITYAGREAASTDTFEVTGLQSRQAPEGNLIFYIIGAVGGIAVLALILIKRSRPSHQPSGTQTEGG
jgi:hypothetical protein